MGAILAASRAAGQASGKLAPGGRLALAYAGSTMRTSAQIRSGFLVCAVAIMASGCGESPPANAYLTPPGGGDRYAKGSLGLGEAHLRAEVCDGVAENKPDQTRLDENALAAFLQ